MLPSSLEQLEARFPGIRFREPLIVNGDRLACRVCIANQGLLGSEIPKLPTELADFHAHMLEFHGVKVPSGC